MKFQENHHLKNKIAALNSYEAAPSNDGVINLENDHKDRLEINIINVDGGFQEIEIIYGEKKKRKKLSKFLPENFARFIYSLQKSPSPSANLGATNLANLSSGTENHYFLQEKFLRILIKISQVSELKTPEKIWDSEERINTSEKAILVAVMNRFKPDNEKLDRLAVSSRSYEISNQNSFKNFISEVLELTKNPEKLAQVLFGNSIQNLSGERKINLNNCLKNLIAETDDSKRNHQMKFLQKLAEDLSDVKTFRQI